MHSSPKLHARAATALSRLAATFLLAVALPASGATITVNSLADADADDGECTLREAIIAANSTNPSGSMPGECIGGELDPLVDRIEFDAGVSGTITLASSLPMILDPVEILGPGAGQLVIDGASITSPALRVADDTLIEDVAFANTASNTAGGAISANQPLTLRKVVIENNQATDGGGIYATEDLTIEQCTFRNNTATDFDGGAIRLADAGKTLVVRDSLFENNSTGASGRNGGAINVGGSDHVTVISGSTFVGNSALGNNREGGAIRIGGASLTILNATFSGNSTTGSGGAISLRSLSHHIANITVVDNASDTDEDGFGDGGGLWNGNDLPGTIENSLIAGNTDHGDDGPDCFGGFTSDGFNLIGDGSGCGGFTQGVSGDQVGTMTSPIDPVLAPLEDNGGPTPTRALLPGSPAIDAGNPAGCTDASDLPLAVDQRGRARPSDGDADGSAICDAGAFELAADLVFADRFED